MSAVKTCISRVGFFSFFTKTIKICFFFQNQFNIFDKMKEN